MAKGYYLVVGDKTTCGGKIIEGDPTHNLLGLPVAREQDRVICGQHPGVYKILGHISGDTIHGRYFAGTAHSKSSCPCQAKFIPSRTNDTYEVGGGASKDVSSLDEPVQQRQSIKKEDDLSSQKKDSTQSPPKPRPEPLSLPALIFETKRKMDDYSADDMRHGDLTEDTLKNKYDLRDVSARLDPYAWADKKASAAILFEEFKTLSDMFSFQGEYKDVMRQMISHMQQNSGERFKSAQLDKAMKEHIVNDDSNESSLRLIRDAISQNIDWDDKIYPLKMKSKITEAVKRSVLPKFNNWEDNTNGLVITVHDTWSTQITLQSLEVNGNSYKAKVYYKIQDHFGLDDIDISNVIYHQFRIFRVWFVLQRWTEYNYKPFITEMNVTVDINGER